MSKMAPHYSGGERGEGKATMHTKRGMGGFRLLCVPGAIISQIKRGGGGEGDIDVEWMDVVDKKKAALISTYMKKQKPTSVCLSCNACTSIFFFLKGGEGEVSSSN